MKSHQLAFALVALVSTLFSLSAKDRPNILFIMSDDHTAQAIGAYATLLKEIDPTPTIDKLAEEGSSLKTRSAPILSARRPERISLPVSTIITTEYLTWVEALGLTSKHCLS